MRSVAPPRVGGVTPSWPVAWKALRVDDRGRVAAHFDDPLPSLPVPVADLHLAARENNVARTAGLLDACADADVADAHGVAPVHEAAGSGALGVVKFLLNDNSEDVNLETVDGRTPLHFAAAGGHLAVVRALLGAPGVNVRAASKDGATVLHWAALGGSAAVVRLLLESIGPPSDDEADVAADTLTSPGGLTPVHYAAAGGDEPSLLVLLSARGGVAAAGLADACGWTCGSPVPPEAEHQW